MRPIVVMLLLSSVACATAHTGAEQAETQNLHIAGAGSLRMTASEGAKVSTIGAPVEKVWDVLKPIYDSLDIPIDNLDGSRHVIGHSGMKLHKQLGKVSLSRIIDCGSTQGFPSADTYEIQLSVFTMAESAPGGMTKLSTMLQAVGRPMAFGGEFIKCKSKGTLEASIADAARLWMAKSA